MEKDLEESGIYKRALLQDLNKCDFRRLSDLPIETRADIDYMEPILFAVKNELNTFRVYKYYAENFNHLMIKLSIRNEFSVF